MGDSGREVKLSGVFISPFTSVGGAWTSSAGTNPLLTLQKWERQGTSLTLDVDTGITLTSVNVSLSNYHLIEGQPLSQTLIVYEITLLEGATS